MNDEECLKQIVTNLRCAMNELRSAEKNIDKRERDYYHSCDGFSRLVHQVENIYREYYNYYCSAVKKRVIGDE